MLNQKSSRDSKAKLMNMADLHLGIIGWGYWGPKLARNLDALPQTMVTMVADQDPYRLASLEVNQPWVRTTTQVEEIFLSDVHGVSLHHL